MKQQTINQKQMKAIIFALFAGVLSNAGMAIASDAKSAGGEKPVEIEVAARRGQRKPAQKRKPVVEVQQIQQIVQAAVAQEIPQGSTVTTDQVQLLFPTATKGDAQELAAEAAKNTAVNDAIIHHDLKTLGKEANKQGDASPFKKAIEQVVAGEQKVDQDSYAYTKALLKNVPQESPLRESVTAAVLEIFTPKTKTASVHRPDAKKGHVEDGAQTFDRNQYYSDPLPRAKRALNFGRDDILKTLKETRTELKEIKGKADAHEAKLSQLEAEKKGLEGKQAALPEPQDERLKMLENTVNDLKGSRDKAAALEAKVAQLEAEKKALEGKQVVLPEAASLFSTLRNYLLTGVVAAGCVYLFLKYNPQKASTKPAKTA